MSLLHCASFLIHICRVLSSMQGENREAEGSLPYNREREA